MFEFFFCVIKVFDIILGDLYILFPLLIILILPKINEWYSFFQIYSKRCLS